VAQGGKSSRRVSPSAASSQEGKEVTEEKVYIDINHLTFAYPGRPAVLKDLNMQLTAGSRCLLIGANGAGKSTLLRILAGRHLIKPDESVRILGKSVFHDTSLNFERSYLDTDWGMRTVAFAGYGCPLQADIPVHGMMTKLQNEYPERRDELIKLLRIDPSKHRLLFSLA
jgi:CCR4-NOT complex subunit CAF16